MFKFNLKGLGMEFSIAPCCWGVYWPTGNSLSWEEYLQKAVDVGYGATELGPFGFGPKSADAMVESLQHHGIVLVGAAHVHTLADQSTLGALTQNTRLICRLLAETGGGQFVLMDESEFYPKDRMGQVTVVQWRAMILQVTEAAKIANDHGLTFSFHPHVGTCVETEDQIERLLSETDPEQVGLCLDTGHHAYWNADPLKFLHKHRARVTAVHLKNVDPEVRARVHRERIHCDDAFKVGVLTDLERGAVDIAAFVADLEEAGFSGPVVVEQDLSPINPRSPEEIAKGNLQYLKSILARGIRAEEVAR